MAVVLMEPLLTGVAELREVRRPLDTAEPRIIDADAARKGFEQSSRVAAVESGLGGLEVTHLSEMGRLVDHLSEFGEPGHEVRLPCASSAAVSPQSAVDMELSGQFGFSSSADRGRKGDDSPMATGNERARRTRSQRLDEILRGVRALTDASIRRHRLARDTPEYVAALETEERLADRIWDLGAVVDAEADEDPGIEDTPD